MKEGYKIPIIKHLEDQDNLLQGRDAELIPGQVEEVEEISKALYEDILEQGFKAVILDISPKKRAQSTASLVSASLREKLPNIHILKRVSENLREIDQGDFVLPENYIPGDEFQGLKIAGRIFSNETFNPIDPKLDNLTYKFGDPFLQEDGSYKYPELLEYFSDSGESYRDVLMRFYGEVIELAETLPRYGKDVGPVVFTHGQPHQIFNDLSVVADRIKKEGFTFEPGELPRICWDIYQNRRKDVVPFGKIDFVSAEHICDPEMIKLLSREVSILKEL